MSGTPSRFTTHVNRIGFQSGRGAFEGPCRGLTPEAPSAVGYRPYNDRDVESPCMPPRSRASTAYARAATALKTAAGPACAS